MAEENSLDLQALSHATVLEAFDRDSTTLSCSASPALINLMAHPSSKIQANVLALCRCRIK
jgi:hypothetical protein